MNFIILASRHHSMFRRTSCLILLQLSRFFAIHTTHIQVFELECTANKSRVLVKQQVEIKTAETRTFCMFKVWLQRENSYEIVISLRTLMSWARACWFARSFLEQPGRSNKVAIALHFEERPLTKSALHVGMHFQLSRHLFCWHEGRNRLVAALEQWCWKLEIGNDIIDETFGHRLFIVEKNHPLWHRAVMLR